MKRKGALYAGLATVLTLACGSSCNEAIFEAARSKERQKKFETASTLYWTGSLWPHTLREYELRKSRAMPRDVDAKRNRLLEEENIQGLEELAEQNPNPLLFVDIGRLYALSDAHAQGIPWLERGVEAEPSYPYAHLLLGDCYLDRYQDSKDAADLTAAKHHFTVAHQLKPTNATQTRLAVIDRF